MWDICKRNCLCLGTPITQESSSPDQNCPYTIVDQRGEPIQLARGHCRNKECGLCILMNKLDVKDVLVEVGVSKDYLLRIKLISSECIGFVLFSEDLSQEARRDLTAAFCRLMCCGETRLRNIANVGVIVQMCPNLQDVRLMRGWGEFWNTFSKFGVAIGYQQTERNKLATLLYLRHSCLPNADSNWHHYLEPSDRASADTLMSTVFAGCFNAQSQPENAVA